MVGKNNHQKVAQNNLSTHYKAYKVGKHWVFASIASLTFGAAIFFSGNLTTFAATDSTVTTTQVANDSTSNSSSATSSSTTATDTSNTDSVSTATSDSADSATSQSSTDTSTNDTSSDSSNQATSQSQASADTTTNDTATTDASKTDVAKTATTSTSQTTKTTASEPSTNTSSNTKTADTSTAQAQSTTSDSSTNSAPTVTSSSTTPQVAATDATQATATTPTTTTVTTPTAATINTVTLTDATAAELADAKTAAATQYALTGQAQAVNATLATATSGKISISVPTTTLGAGTNSTNSTTKYTITVSFSNIVAGDIVTVNIPTDLDTLKYEPNNSGITDMGANQYGTETVTQNADGTTTVTYTFTSTPGTNFSNAMTISQAGNISSTAVSADQAGQTVTRAITTTLNGKDDASVALTQYYEPSVTIPTSPTRFTPSTSTTPAVNADTDYIYTFSINDVNNYGNNYASTRVASSLNAGGTVITIPTPASFTLNSNLTASLNDFNDGTTITQAGTGADIIITVPAGKGSTGSLLYPYYLAGSYDITQTDTTQTVTAASGASIVQINAAGTYTATTADNSVWTETIAAADTTITSATVTGTGNSKSGSAIALDSITSDDPEYINQVAFTLNSASNVTDGVITLTIPSGINATGFYVPTTSSTLVNNTTNVLLNYTTGTTSYGYVVTYLDGTTATGTVAAGDKFESTNSSPIRQIVLTPNYIAAGAGKLVISTIGTLSTTYDDGTSVKNNDELTFKSDISFPGEGNETITSTNVQTVTAGVAKTALFAWNQQTTTPGTGLGSYVSISQGDFDSTTDYVYEPIIYFVLPASHAIAATNPVTIPAADLAAGAQISYYTTDTGQTGVKIDYTGTGEYVNLNEPTGTYKVTLGNILPDAVNGQYKASLYMTSLTTALTDNGGNTTKPTDKTLVDGDINAIYIDAQMFTVSTSSTTTNSSFAQGNTNNDAVSAGTSDVSGASQMDFYTNVTNSTDVTDTNTGVIVNLPTVGDSQGSTYDFELTGPITLPTNFTNSSNNGATMSGTVYYSTQLFDTSNSTATPDLSNYVTEDQVTDWSTIRSVYISIGNLPTSNSTGRIDISGTAKDFAAQGNHTGYLQTALYINGLAPTVTNKAASIAITGTSTVNVQFHYVDDNGDDQYISLADLQKTYKDNVDTLTASTYPSSASGFSATDTNLIPSGYWLATNADGSLKVSILNSDHGDYDGMPNDTAAFGTTVAYYFDGDTITYELTDGKVVDTIAYVDSTDGSTVLTQKVKGTPGDTTTVNITAPTNYTLKAGTPATYDLTFGDTDSTSPVYTVYLDHAVSTQEYTIPNTVNYTGLPAGVTPSKGTWTSSTVDANGNTVYSVSQDVTWTASTDEVTGITTYATVPNYSIVDTPTVAGYTPTAESTSFDLKSSTTYPSSQTATVNYVADAQSVDMKFVDDDNAGAQVGDTQTLSGVTGSTAKWQVQAPANYALADGQSATGTYTFSTKNNEPITIHLVHALTAGTASSTYTVTYTGLPADKALTDNTQTMNWTTSTDDVTGITTYTPASTSEAATIPPVAGYTADPDESSFSFATSTTAPTPQSLTVNYTANDQTIKVNYVDDVTGDSIASSNTTLTGTTDQTGTYTVKVPTNYELATGQASTVDYTFSADAAQNAITIHLTHAISYSTVNTTQTVNYRLTGTTTDLAAATTQTISWKAATDKVTNQTVYTPQGAYAATTAATVAGYTPTTASVAAVTPDASTSAPTDTSATIYYTADPQSITINYVDATNSEKVNNASVTLHGATGESGSITVIVPAGYVLAKGQAADIAYTFSADAAKNVINVQLAHAVNHSTVTTTQTVNYYLKGTTTALAPATTQSLTWNVSTDAVTGDSIYTPQGGYNATKAASITGYTPTNTSVAAVNPDASTTAPSDTSAAIYYTADALSIPVSYVDDVTGKSIASAAETLTGTIGETGTYTVKVPTGYTLAADQASSVAYTFTEAGSAITVHLTHNITHSTATTTRTISYLVAGTQTSLKPATVQTITWNVSTDDVTGETVATPQDGYAAVTAPTITGYTTTSTGIASANPAPTSADQLANSTATIEYTAVSTDNGGGNNGGTTTGGNTTGGTTGETSGDSTTGGTSTSTSGDNTTGATGTTTTTPKPGETTTTEPGTTVAPETTSTETDGTRVNAQTTTTSSEAKAVAATTRMAKYHTDANTSKAKLPQTNDANENSMAVMGLSLLSALGILGLAKRRRKGDE